MPPVPWDSTVRRLVAEAVFVKTFRSLYMLVVVESAFNQLNEFEVKSIWLDVFATMVFTPEPFTRKVKVLSAPKAPMNRSPVAVTCATDRFPAKEADAAVRFPTTFALGVEIPVLSIVKKTFASVVGVNASIANWTPNAWLITMLLTEGVPRVHW